VVEGIRISIFSLADYQLIATFGNKGEGPQEFLQRANNPLSLILQEDQLVVRSYGKLTYFKKNGQYLKEMKMNPRSGREHQPFNQGFVARFVTRLEGGDLDHGIALYDKDFNKQKELYRHAHGFPLYRKFEFNPLTIHQPYFKIIDQSIIVLDGARSVVNIYDESGVLKASLKNNNELRPFTNEDKKRLIQSYQRDRFFSTFYNRYQKLFKFPDYFPPFYWFYVDKRDKTIYLSTYKIENNHRIYLVHKMTGEFKKRMGLPYVRGQSELLTAIFNKKLYQLVEVDEEWHLRISPIR
jgi:hypothetical protein